MAKEAQESEFGDGVTFSIYALLDGQALTETTHPIYTRHIDPAHNISDRGFFPVEIDLSPYIHRDLKLVLETTPGPTGDIQMDWAAWVKPRLADYYPKTLELVYDGPTKIFENKLAFPRAWIVHQVSQVALNDRANVRQRLSSPDFDPAVEAVVETNEPLPDFDSRNRAHTASERVRITLYTSKRVEMDVNLSEPGLLVFSDMMYPGWKALVDGKGQSIKTANLIMRGLPLPAGQHQVVFYFAPPLFYIGLGSTLISLLLALGGLLMFKGDFSLRPLSAIRRRKQSIKD